jgi:predicted small lipoprotein YifL
MVNVAKMKVIGIALLGVFVLTACGQKLALYLPEEPITNNTTSDSEPSTDSAEQGKN